MHKFLFFPHNIFIFFKKETKKVKNKNMDSIHSIWSETNKPDQFNPLTGDVKTNTLIIGGGIAGILCARFLHNAGVDYILAEGDKIGGGITKNTTAKITSQHGLIYHKLLKKAGIEKTGMYLHANQCALNEYRNFCKNIDCDFEDKDAYVYSLDDEKMIANEMSALHKMGFKAEFKDKINLPFDIKGAAKFPNQAQFHPLKFIAGISKGLNIFEHTFVKEIAPHTVVTNHGRITSENIIVATHFPFLNKYGGYYLKMHQHRSYAIALENAADVDGMYLEEKDNGLSFRNYGSYLIVGGGDHRTGKKGGNWDILRDFAAHTYPGSREKYAWATQDCITLDGVPYIGKYGKSAEGLYVATGFNKWGMTSSMVSAMILTDMVLDRKNDYAEVFSPQRSMMKGRLIMNALTAAGNLLSFSMRRCPHMGCALKWNPVERTWDCPCHGSRFENDGTLIDNPATGALKKRK